MLFYIPVHGAGTLCGKGLSKANSSTIGKEKETNWSLQPMTEEEFVEALLSDQPFIPAYFPFDVDLNRKGAAPFKQSISAVKIANAVKNETDTDRLNKDNMDCRCKTRERLQERSPASISEPDGRHKV